MTAPTFRLSRRQLTLLVFLVTVCVTPFTFDSVLFTHLGRLAWMALIPAFGVGLTGLLTALALMAAFPGESILEYAPRILGPLLGRGFLLMLGTLLLLGAPFNLNTLSRVVAFVDLQNTPLLLPAALFGALLCLPCYFGPEVFARVGEILAWGIALGLVFILLAPLWSAVPARLMPLTGFSWSNYWPPAVSSTMGAVRGFLCVLVLGGAVRGEGRGMAGPAVGALSLAWLVLTLGLATPVAVLGTGLVEHLKYPLLAVTGTVTLRWFPFQRLTMVTGLVWEAIMYVVLSFYLWSGVHVLCMSLGIRRWRAALVPAATLTIAIGGTRFGAGPDRMLIDAWNFAVVGLGVAAPILLLLASRIRQAARDPAGAGPEAA